MPENAVDPGRFERAVTDYASRPLRVAFVGRLVPYKGAEILVRAAAPLARAGLVVLDIIGNGPDRARLRELIVREGLEGKVHLDGWVAHARLQDRLSQSNVFCFPSVREFGGAVVMEAMALGLVPVVVSYGGPGEIVTDDVGVRIPVGSVDSLTANVRASLEYLLAMPPHELARMGERAKRRILEGYSIGAKREKTRQIYAWVLGELNERPKLEPPAHALSFYH